MPFSFNSFPATDASATVASVPGLSPAVSGLLPQSASTSANASFDTCLTHAKLTPGAIPPKALTTIKVAADAAGKSDAATGSADGEKEENDDTSTTTEAAPADAVVDPLAGLNHLLGLVVPPPTAPVAAVATDTDATASTLNADGSGNGAPLGDAMGSTPSKIGASPVSKAHFTKTLGAPSTDSPDQVSTGSPVAGITKGTKTDVKRSVAADGKADAQTDVVIPALDQPVDAGSMQTSVRSPLPRGAKMPLAKPLGRMPANGSSVTNLFPVAKALETTTEGDVPPVANGVQSLRAMMLTSAPAEAPAAESVGLRGLANPAPILGAQAAAAAAAAATNNSSIAGAPTARDLIASGAPVLEYCVSPDQTLTVSAPKSGRAQKNGFSLSSPTDASAVFTPTAVPDTINAGSVAATMPTKISSSDVTTVSVTQGAQDGESDQLGTLTPQAVAVEVTQAQKTPLTSPVASHFDGAITPQAKIAVADDNRVFSLASGDKPSTRERKNNMLLTDSKGVTQSAAGVGTDTAKRVSAMSNNNPVYAENARSSDPFLSLAGLSVAASNESYSSAAESAPASPVLSSHAARAVREIRDIADGLWAVDRSSVEVRFNFTETEKLSVRVELKDGAVHTTFRTDSPELRDTLAREWQTQTPTAGSDIRPYRVADPVFGSGSSNNDQHSGFNGGDASRQQQQQQQRSFEQSSGGGSLSFSSPRGSGTSTVSAPNSALRILKTDTSIHLNAFA